MIAFATVGMFAATTLILGLLLAFTPHLMRKNECFAVTIPAVAQADPRLVALKKRYTSLMITLTVILTVVSVIASSLMITGTEQSNNSTTVIGIVLECVSIFGLTVISFILMLQNRRKVQEIKRDEGWTAKHQEIATAIAEKDFPKPLPLTWNILYIPIILGTLALGLVLYPTMPETIPMHSDLSGNVDRWEPKSLGNVIGFPVIFDLFMAACFVFSHWMILRSKRHSDPDAPATSALAYGLFARAQSIFLLIAGVVITSSIGILFLLSSAGLATLGQTTVIIIVISLFILIGCLALSLIYGQAGSRVFKRMQENDTLLADDDTHWKLGVFYFNPEDASIFLPERFGIGWTMNFARPAAWAIILGGILITAAFIGALMLLF